MRIFRSPARGIVDSANPYEVRRGRHYQKREHGRKEKRRGLAPPLLQKKAEPRNYCRGGYVYCNICVFFHSVRRKAKTDGTPQNARAEKKSERRRKIQGRGGCRKSNRRRKFKGLARPAKEAKTPPRRAGNSIRKRAARIAAPARDGESPRRGLSESGGNHFAAGAVALTAFITSCVMSTSGLEK